MIVFNPDLTPVQILEAGAFGGSYFASATWGDLQGLGEASALAEQNEALRYDRGRNKFGVKAGQSFEQWTWNGWIFPEDPLGWFHWYCRYSAGRRHERDAHQIGRWSSFKGRWTTNKNLSNSLVIRQSLLHWGLEAERYVR